MMHWHCHLGYSKKREEGFWNSEEYKMKKNSQNARRKNQHAGQNLSRLRTPWAFAYTCKLSYYLMKYVVIMQHPKISAIFFTVLLFLPFSHICHGDAGTKYSCSFAVLFYQSFFKCYLKFGIVHYYRLRLKLSGFYSC